MVVKTFNHAYSVSFAVSGSRYEDAHEAMRQEQYLVIAALLKRVAALISEEPYEYEEAIEAWDTYEEPKLPNNQESVIL